ncbi:MAG: glycosyltransferase family 4 protein [Patescibacteria group bacterium]
MKIAQIAPIVERVPPKKYGGTERVVSAITEELIKRGHQVTLFATADSITSAKLIGTTKNGIRELGINDDYSRNGLVLSHVGQAYNRAKEFDIIHDHVGVLSLPTAHISPTPVVMTIHGSFGDHNKKTFLSLDNPFFVTISDSQSRPVRALRHRTTIYNGLEMSHYPFHSSAAQDFLLYVGRITPIKGTDIAVKVARLLNKPLIIAAKLEEQNRAYFENEIKPYLSSQIRLIGEVDENQRNWLMSRAKCLLHPATWEEPFGLTLIEAMACGCPVVAFNKGSIPEIVLNKQTGFIVDDIPEMVKAISQIEKIDRRYCRLYSINSFSAARMVDSYEYLYELIVNQNNAQEEQFTNWQKMRLIAR